MTETSRSLTSRHRARLLSVLAGSAIIVAACGSTGGPTTQPNATGEADLSGTISIDGSSTVYPITEAVAEEFQNANPGIQVSVAFSGTGGGFEKFCAGEKDANDASRPIKTEDTPDAKSEATLCNEAGITPVELIVAYDGLSVVVNPQNTWVDCLTVAELATIFGPDATAEQTWADVRSGWPAEKIERFMPGIDSGTFDYFTEFINGEVDVSTQAGTFSEDDNQLVQGVAGDTSGIGYFGFAYYEENTDKLKIVPVDGGAGCITPSLETIRDGSYAPLSRPLFVYPSVESLARPEVAAFFRFYLDNTDALSAEVGYVPLPDDVLQQAKDALAAATGS